jgi:excisionase family DNA binding protein
MHDEGSQTPSLPPTRWLTAREGCRYARCGRRVFNDAVRAGVLRVARVGGRQEVRVTREAIDTWLESLARG